MGLPQKTAMARALTEARAEGHPIERFGLDSEQDGYAIQELGLQHRKDGGESPVGFKVGLTSVAKRQQMGLHHPVYGELTGHMQVPHGGEFSLKGAIHPKIEPEVAFLIKGPLTAPVDLQQVWARCDGVCLALEILDSRYREFRYFSLGDVIADNSSSSHFVLGPWARPHELGEFSLTMSVNGKVATQGETRAISGHPLTSVVELCSLLQKRGRAMEHGHAIVLAGAATEAVSLEEGMVVELEAMPFESVRVSVSR